MATDRGRRAVALFVVAAVLATLVVESDVFVRRLADRRAGDVGGGCVSLDGLRVDLGTFPVGLRALAGRLDVRARADWAVLGDLRLGDIDARARGVRSSLFGGVDDVRVGHATVTAALAGAELARYLRAAGVPGTIRVDRQGVRVLLPLLAVPVRLRVRAEGGAVAVTPDTGTLPAVVRFTVRVPGVHVDDVRAAPDGLRIAASLRGRPSAIACDAARALERLSPFRR